MNKAILTISPDDLVCMNDHATAHYYRIDLAYARDDNLLFGERIYRPDAKLWLYKDLADITMTAALYCYETYGLHFILYDGLRTIEAQEAMTKTARVRENPHWLEPPRLLSPPGSGGHPRGMAIDIGLEDKDGTLIDMGCAFDYLAENSNPEHNPAHREYKHAKHIQNNRSKLDKSMIYGATKHQTALTPLTEEWWDYRLPSKFYNRFKPLSEADILPQQKVMKKGT